MCVHAVRPRRLVEASLIQKLSASEITGRHSIAMMKIVVAIMRLQVRRVHSLPSVGL